MNIKIAGNKICPIMKPSNQACITTNCMMWESHIMNNKDYDFHGPDQRRWIEDPENGDCGLKSKELEVNF